jgi:hypothetical protein
MTAMENPDWLEITDETDPTDKRGWPQTNTEFLSAIFGEALDGSNLAPFVTSFGGCPKLSKKWRGEPWFANQELPDASELNWYFSLAVYRAGDNGFSRIERNCAKVFGVMLDDLGSKALPLDRLDECPPSYVIETSPGNYQVGYLFSEPETDNARVKFLNEAMVLAELCDPGAKSPATRYGRLPYASNGKASLAEPFRCRLIAWRTEARYSFEEIFERLELPLPEVKALTKRRTSISVAKQGDDVYLPRAAENEVLTALRARGLYKRPLGEGKHDITCPWVAEHTGGVDDGACYFEPSDFAPIGGFRCHHSHNNEQRRIRELLAFLVVTPQEAKHKPTVRVVAGELHRVLDAAEVELSGSGRYYQRGGLIVSVVTDPENRSTTIRPLSIAALTRALSSLAIWERYNAQHQEWFITDPPARHVSTLHDAERFQHLLPLAGIAHQPFMRETGEVVKLSGYDARSGMFGVFDERAYTVSDTPTRDEALRALEAMRELISEFAFATAADESSALAAMLTATIRPTLDQAPMFHVRAATPGSGKSYLTALIAAFASEGAPSAISFPTTEEECSKLLLATLLEAPAVVLFDNLTTDIETLKALCSAITEPQIKGRVLGVSKNASVGTRALFLSSGNNVDATRDMTRRVVTILLDPNEENPAARSFSKDPVRIVRQDRARFVSLALTILRAWFAAGSPQAGVKPFTGFAMWCEFIRQPLLWLGLPDPLARTYDRMESDPHREAVGRVLCAWFDAFGSSPTRIRDAADRADSLGGELREVLMEVAERQREINRRALGKWVARHERQVVGGLRFERAEGKTSTERWRVVQSVKSDKSFDFSQPSQNEYAPV